MSMPVHELEAEVLGLAAPDRARLLERLIESFDPATPVGEAWLNEALRREEEVVSGKVAMVSGREAVARIRAQLTGMALKASPEFESHAGLPRPQSLSRRAWVSTQVQNRVEAAGMFLQ